MFTVLTLLASVLFLVRLLLLIALHVRPGGVHPLRDAVSDYAASARAGTRRLASVASWSAAAAWAVLGLAVLLGTGGGHTGLGISLLALAIVLALMPMVPTDGPDAETTLRGRIHLLFAVAWFALAYSTISLETRLLEETTGHRAPVLLGPVHVVAAISLACLVLSLLIPALRRRTFGLSERVFIAAVTLAPLIVSLGLVGA